MVLKKLFNRAEPEPVARSIPAGERVYAIGDIHGRRDCFDALLKAIDADDAARGPARSTIVLLGDLVDRGADSKGVIQRAIALAGERPTVMLMGNHEEVLITTWEGDRSAAGLFHRIGGRETLMSYGVAAHDYDRCDLGQLGELTAATIPARHVAFLRQFQDQWRCGDYVFAHAGVRPGVALEEQEPSDLRWIRREFLEDRRDHGAMIVHGHSITEDVDEQPNRIGIDTGAFASGRLTAIGLEGGDRWYLST